MAEDALHHQYNPDNRAELFEFLRESLPPNDADRAISRWQWKYESSPYNPPEGPTVDLIRIGSKLVSIVAGYRLKMWMGGIECFAEARGEWLVHPDYRGRKLWRRVGNVLPAEVPMLFGWSVVSAQAVRAIGWATEPVRPMLRVLEAGPLVEQLTRSPRLASIATALNTAARVASESLHRVRRGRSDKVLQLDSFDDRVDVLWERARRPAKAMVVREGRYLNWRYCERPDATYLLYGIEHGSELAGFLVARVGNHRGLRWGYLVDFLVPENSNDVLSSLIGEALDEFGGNGVAAVTCYVTDPGARRVLLRHGFFPSPGRNPIHFNHLLEGSRTDLQRFAALHSWYLTMGDGEFEMNL